MKLLIPEINMPLRMVLISLPECCCLQQKSSPPIVTLPVSTTPRTFQDDLALFLSVLSLERAFEKIVVVLLIQGL